MPGRSLIAELRQEAATTRRLLERVPEDKLRWKPHPKSMSLGELAMHIAMLPRGIVDLVSTLEVAVPTVPRTEAVAVDELLMTLGNSVELAASRLAQWSDEDLAATWTMLNEGRAVLALPRMAVLRSLLFNHWYHHRGQLTVYLRLLDVPLPSVYGPTADIETLG